MVERAVVFIDGANWHYSLKRAGVSSRALDYPRVAQKLLRKRNLCGIRYYVGRVMRNLRLKRAQDGFIRLIQAQGVEVFLGRIEKHKVRPDDNPALRKLTKLVANNREGFSAPVRRKIQALCRESVPHYVEKQVDVRIAVDMVSMAYRNEYDTAFLLSADGDFVPAVSEVRSVGKRVFAASTGDGTQLGDAVNSFIPLAPPWFSTVMR